MEREKKNNGLTILLILLIMCVLVIGVMLLFNGKTLPKESTMVAKSNNKYLSANYSLMMYEKSDNYIKNNIDLDSIQKNKSITIEDDELFDSVSEEYKYCNGNITITKINYGIYQYTITSDCDNVNDSDVHLTMKVYTNINQNSKYQLIDDLTEIKNGYAGVLHNYQYTATNNSASINTDGTAGVISFKNDFSINEIKLFESNISGFHTSLRKLSDGYLLEKDTNDSFKDYVITYYDNDLHKVWEKDNKDFNIQTFQYEDDNNIYFANFNEIYSLNKKNGDIKYLFKLQNVNNADLWFTEYNDGVFYGYRANGSDSVVVYDVDGNVLRNLDVSKYYEEIVGHPSVVTANKNITLYENNRVVYVFDSQNSLVNTIDLREITDSFDIKLTVDDNGYEIIYDGMENNTKYYRKYTTNNELIIDQMLDIDYGYSTLQNFGLNADNMFNQSYIIDGKLIEIMYSPDNNGTELIMLFDYSK